MKQRPSEVVPTKRQWLEEVPEVPLPPKLPASAEMMEEAGHVDGKINRPKTHRLSTAMSPRYPPA